MNKKTSEFPREAWAFHEIPKEELGIAWRLEIECEFDSTIPHWLSLSNETRHHSTWSYELLTKHNKTTVFDMDQPIWPWEKAELETDEEQSAIHSLKIKWSAGKTAIKRDLEAWVDQQLEEFPHKISPNQGGRKNQYRAWFFDLAVLRAANHGLDREQARELLAELINSRQPKKELSDPTEWGKTIADAKKRLTQWKPLAALGIINRRLLSPAKSLAPILVNEDPLLVASEIVDYSLRVGDLEAAKAALLDLAEIQKSDPGRWLKRRLFRSEAEESMRDSAESDQEPSQPVDGEE